MGSSHLLGGLRNADLEAWSCLRLFLSRFLLLYWLGCHHRCHRRSHHLWSCGCYRHRRPRCYRCRLFTSLHEQLGLKVHQRHIRRGWLICEYRWFLGWCALFIFFCPSCDSRTPGRIIIIIITFGLSENRLELFLRRHRILLLLNCSLMQAQLVLFDLFLGGWFRNACTTSRLSHGRAFFEILEEVALRL